MATQPVVTDNQPEVDQETGKFIYTYQPRDSEGQFIGKPYKYLYTDHQDLVRQLTEGKEQGDRWINDVKSGKRTVVGDPAPPRSNYEPAAASTEEAEQRERERFRQMAEKEFGAPIDEVRRDIKESREMKDYTLASSWAIENEGNGYFPCPENGRKMSAYLTENKFALNRKNLDLAFEALRDSLKTAPEPSAPPADSTQQQTSTRTEAKPQSTGIIPGQFQGTRPGAQGERQPLTRERFRQIDKLNRDDWMKLQRDKPKEAQAFLAMKHPAQPQQ